MNVLKVLILCIVFFSIYFELYFKLLFELGPVALTHTYTYTVCLKN